MPTEPRSAGSTLDAPIATFALSEAFLDALLDRVRRGERFPASFEDSMSVPGLGVGSVRVDFGITDLRLQLRERGLGRVGIRVRLRGDLAWNFALGRARQTVEASFTCMVRPEVRLTEAGRVMLAADFAAAKVREVRLDVVDTSYLPGDLQAELLGPVGRRALDRVGAEVVVRAVQSFGRRETELDGPLGTWLMILGAAPQAAQVRVLDHVVQVAVGGPIAAARLDVPDTAIHVAVAADAAPRLLAHWAADLSDGGAGGEIAVDVIDVGFDDGGLIVAHARVTWTPPRVRRSVTVTAEVHGRILLGGDDDLQVVVTDVRVRGADGAAVRGASTVARLLDRWLTNRLHLRVLWRLPLPFSGDADPNHGGWRLGIDDVTVGAEHLDIGVTAWFFPVSSPT